MKYAVSSEGITALKAVALEVTEALEALERGTKSLKTAAEGMKELGPHRASLDAALEDVAESLRQAAGPAETIAEKLEEVAEAYEEIIEYDRFRASSGPGSSSGGASSGGGASGAAQYGPVSHEMAEALHTPVKQRTPRQVELADLAVHGDYADQKSFETDPETGRVLRDEEGRPLEGSRGGRGTQRPDGYKIDEFGRVDLREQKDYTNVYNLIRNITRQTEKRRLGFGDDVQITFVVAVNQFSVGDAEKVAALEDALGIRIEWMTK